MVRKYIILLLGMFIVSNNLLSMRPNLYPTVAPSAPHQDALPMRGQVTPEQIAMIEDDFSKLNAYYDWIKGEINKYTSTVKNFQTLAPDDQDIVIEKFIWILPIHFKPYVFYLFKEGMQDADQAITMDDWVRFSEYILANGALPKFNSGEFDKALNYVMQSRKTKTLSYWEYAQYIGSGALGGALQGGGAGALTGIAVPALINRSGTTAENVGSGAVVGAGLGAAGGLLKGAYKGREAAQLQDEQLKTDNISATKGMALKQSPSLFQRLKNYWRGPKRRGTN